MCSFAVSSNIRKPERLYYIGQGKTVAEVELYLLQRNYGVVRQELWRTCPQFQANAYAQLRRLCLLQGHVLLSHN